MSDLDSATLGALAGLTSMTRLSIRDCSLRTTGSSAKKFLQENEDALQRDMLRLLYSLTGWQCGIFPLRVL